MIFFHELGHYLMIRNLGIKKYRFFILGIRFESNDEESKKVLLSGILLGFVPLIIVSALGIFHEIVILIMLISYLIPCWSDIRNIREKGGIRLE